MTNDIKEVLLSEEQIAKVVKKIAEEISRDYKDKNPLIISVLKGSFVFMADLVRQIKIPCAIDFMSISSYGKGTKTSGEVKINKDLDTKIENRHLIVVEDILDSGLTLSYILDMFKARGPASVKLCTLLDKPDRRKIPVKIDYNGFTIPDEFVVGYGLDYDEKYRNLPYIGILKPEIYSAK
ncbi:MAG: hypoxanthine phosphoribosyltransferase [Clostridiales bacterium]|nr:hypoxanthine phosphoribosyltransferase [Clostridiales bacterium]